MTDEITVLSGATIQHGKYNDRIYVLSFPDKCTEETVDDIEKLALEKGYSKIVAKISGTRQGLFTGKGFITEAVLPLSGAGHEQVLFVSKFPVSERQKENNAQLQSEILQKALARDKETTIPLLTELCVRMSPADAVDMAEVYKAVFESYPFPIHDPEFIRKTMSENTAYFGIRENGSLIALSSAEMYPKMHAAEMTDFATLPSARGKGCANALLARMERELPALGIQTFYTIARAASFGMNITFARRGYEFGGSLINNTNICGSIETMNIWHKHA
jgi:putative beta-lysine N-acetyltransferase